MSNQRRLGRGLEALLGRSLDEPTTASTTTESISLPTDPADEGMHASMDRDYNGQLWLDLVSIDTNPHQPRKEFDELEIADLADSIREHGVIQPLVVRQAGDRFQLIAGERRLRAAQAAGWERVPVQVRDVTDQQMAELAIVENVQRKDLNPLEKAACFQKYLQDYSCTQEDLASRIHIDRSTIANLIRLLELPEPVKKMVSKSEITQGHARALLPLGDEDRQIDFAYRVRAESLSVRAIEQMVQDAMAEESGDLLAMPGLENNPSKPKATRSEQLAMLEQELKAALGTKVALTQNAKGKGKVTIHFADAEEFERLRSMLTGAGPVQSTPQVVTESVEPAPIMETESTMEPQFDTMQDGMNDFPAAA
ncbi:ParB/RepB/Spo0J family partition protein [Aeoliella mucimassa]|uniref:Putative chromosome-partitioning protein ParB n=1 Tax=Aeoliella mucimassa TaxID=2527972 RepID=A0A518AU85_9BACT|nr:ParB/RepB/Spo0J family partition protein [Aeoliella mucimassa]QDU58287.1 putative chromosome-partitioning protein ParB [Aeoliella mucimassa]